MSDGGTTGGGRVATRRSAGPRGARALAFLLGALAVARAGAEEESGAPARAGARHVRGVTISCQTNGREWASDGFGAELDRLRALGVNWVAIHPYARIGADGTVRYRPLDPAAPPEHVARPIREARARGMAILVKPHLAYWGSPFRWRGEIDFAEPAALERFFASYGAWITDLATVCRDADAFCVGTELDRLVRHEARWREIVERVRARTGARLTFAANWTDYAGVPFWDALDCVGVQGYFPLSAEPDPNAAELAAGWRGVIAELRAVHERTGKPVVLTELGYDRSLDAARTPWTSGRVPASEAARAAALQERCFAAALAALEPERAWLRGAFLWKWFVGPAPGEDFVVDTPALRAVVARWWGRAASQGR